MREIKFRAWDKKTKTVWEVEELSWCDPCFIVAEPGLEHTDIQDRDFRTKRVPDDIALMQYTGLKDKNGKEIYEGDIVKHRGLAGARDFTLYGIIEHFMVDNLEVVVWRGAGFYPFLRWWDVPRVVEDLEYEVISNIYENPELLEGK